MAAFCKIQTRNELADFLRVPRKKLTHVLFIQKTENCYNSFDIPKRSGGVRTIHAPTHDLKMIQRCLADALVACQQELQGEYAHRRNISHAFEKGKTIITNAKAHRNKRFVVTIDLENYFETFHIGRVIGYFEKNKFFTLPHEVAVTIAQIACYKGRLPQGAPCSPVISNLIFQTVDMRVLRLAKKYKLHYTRYADDLTFSTNNLDFLDQYDSFLSCLNAEIEGSGFSVNQRKTRLLLRESQQKVTGLIVNKKINVDSKYSRATRAMAHSLYTTGRYTIHGQEATIKQLEGRFAFIDQIDKYNNGLDKESQYNKHDSFHLSSRERQYQAFLFYKYFYANSYPLVITEGKTDILYVKAALKSLYQEYPNLIEKKADGTFIFKFSFLKRSDRFRYFFGVSKDGADSVSNLYPYFSCKAKGQDGPRNYLEYFSKMCTHEQMNPVILLYDFEPHNKKPLAKLIGAAGIHNSSDTLKRDLFIKLTNKGALFLLTIPTPESRAECEIEDLFTQETLNHRIEGKVFSRSDQYCKTTEYGKNQFSEYIYINYEHINFQGFRPLLDALNHIIIG